MLLRIVLLAGFSFHAFYFWNRGGAWLNTHSGLSVFLHNPDFSDTQQPTLCWVRNKFFFPKGTILRAAELSGLWSGMVFFRHSPLDSPASVTCSFMHAFPDPVLTQEQPRPPAGGVCEYLVTMYHLGCWGWVSLWYLRPTCVSFLGLLKQSTTN